MKCTSKSITWSALPESGCIKGYDGGKQIKGRKRHLLVDTLGLLLSVYVTPANTSDQEGARRLLVGLKPLQPRLELIWADSAYGGTPLVTWCAAEGAWRVEIIKPVPHVQGFVVRPWCWIVERTLGWMGRQRRLSKDYEGKVQTSETLLKLAMIRLMVGLWREAQHDFQNTLSARLYPFITICVKIDRQ
jgi:putative transposase